MNEYCTWEGEAQQADHVRGLWPPDSQKPSAFARSILAAVVRMGTAESIRTFRVRAGKSAQEIWTALGLNEAWYRDLESYDDELASTLTLFQASQLAALLGVRLKDLVDENVSCEEKIGLLDLPGFIHKHLAREQLSREDFEELVGWELQGFLLSPLAAAAEMPIAFLRDLSSHLGVSLLSLLPEAHAH